jgi:formylglycine-generating enzyme required for sulfatase activity
MSGHCMTLFLAALIAVIMTACSGGGRGGGSAVPSITTQPADQTIIAGQAATLTVVATGDATLHYQWQRGGTNVGTNAASYTVPYAIATDAGSYTVMVTNSAGSATSKPATLTVNPLTILIPDSKGGNVPIELNAIPAGTFWMGSSDVADSGAQPVHQVTLSQNFFISTDLVTQGQWLAVMKNNPSFFTAANGYASAGLKNPVEKVSWDDIATTTGTTYTCFLDALNTATTTQLPAGWSFRLPTEAEWEYACRAGTTTAYYWGDDATGTQIGSYAWYTVNSGGMTQPVGNLLPNAWGLYDMSGNVWEWCQDRFSVYSSNSETDPVGPATGSYRLNRGGYWGWYSNYCRSAFRSNNAQTSRVNSIGFRVVLACRYCPPG